jgi:predicted MPP superfamily phosphohydrolase
MRTTVFFIFFGIILIIFSFANYYLYLRGVQAFSITHPYKRWFQIAFLVITYSFFVGIILERTVSSAFSEWVFRVGTFWLPFMLYLLMAVIAIDIVRFVNFLFHFLPDPSQSFKFTVGLVVVSLVGSVVIAGHINAMIIDVKTIPLTINKKVEGKQEVRVLMASDLHLGALIGERREKHLLKIINNQKPDMVLLCGDLIDSEIAPVLRKKLGRHIQEIKTPMGTYAITGNHEYVGGIEKSLSYLKSIHINMLLDSVVTLPNGIQLVGRNDRSVGYASSGFKTLPTLLTQIDHEKPIIVMNHQPYNLGEASDAKVDLHLSGHTHHGQLWPFNYITKAIFELSWGYLKKGETHFYVSSGFGTWGPTVRLGNRPEVVVFDLKFAN